MSRALDLIARANADCEILAPHLLGIPNKRLSSARSMRWGEHGRLVLNLAGLYQGKWRDWASGQHGDMLDLVEAETGRDRAAALEWLGLYYGEEYAPIDREKRAAERRAAEAEDAKLRTRRQAVAARIWAEAEPLAGSMAERYLLSRFAGHQIPEAVYAADALRWNRRERDTAAAGCMVALMTDPLTGNPTGVHRTYLNANAEQVSRRMLGVAGVVRLWPDHTVAGGLAVGEGIETTLSGALLFDAAPAWALLNAGNLACFSPLPGIEALTIFSDNDEQNERTGRRAGQEAAAECADRWQDAGREVTIRTPRAAGSDFNDMLRQLAENKAA